MFCLEIRFRTGRLVSIRDGAYSRFDRNLIEDFTPIQGLKVMFCLLELIISKLNDLFNVGLPFEICR